MRGTMLWFNEAKESGVITAETGEQLAVQREDFAGRLPPRGRCGGTPVEFEVAEDSDGRKAEQVVLITQVIPRRARRRSAGHRS
jgi:cold shock CspA family protein